MKTGETLRPPDLKESLLKIVAISIPTFILAGLVFHEGIHFIAHWFYHDEFPSVVAIEWMMGFVPMVVADFDGSNLVILLSGPISGVVLSSLFAYQLRYVKQVNSRGIVQGENRWYTSQFIVLGLIIQAVRDAFYLWPIVDPLPFDGAANGDGIDAFELFQQQGLDILGVNPQWLIAVGATIFVIYMLLRTFAHSPFVNNHLATQGL